MLKDRLHLYNALQEKRGSKLIVYVTSDRKGMETQIGNDILSIFVDHLDLIGDVDKISLFLYTRGGNTLTAWSLVNLIRNFCKDFEVIIPFHCHSAGTLISLGANKIVMTKQATLGPIDPSVNGPLNPTIPNKDIKVPVSVEYVNAYLDFAMKELEITNQSRLATLLNNLSDKIHPLTLGQVFKSKSQIQMLAKRLLKYQGLGSDKEDAIIKFLCSDSGSHDYTIHRNEAKEELGLNIEKPDDALYQIIKDIFADIESELLLRTPYDPTVILGKNTNITYSNRRALIESISGNCDVFISEGNLVKQSFQIPNHPIPQQMIQDERLVDSWRHENPPSDNPITQYSI